METSPQFSRSALALPYRAVLVAGALFLGSATVVGPANPVAAGPADVKNPASASRHVDNPFLDARGYVNPEWKARAESVPGGTRVSNTPTGVWIDRVVKIAGTRSAMGLRAHLDAAVAQGAGYIQVVVDDLPRRNCGRSASIGDFEAEELARYRTEFIDPIAAIEADPAYKDLRIVNVLELDSLPYLLVGGADRYLVNCGAVRTSGSYVKGIQYALGRLAEAGPNIYRYLDGSQYSWLGWADNFEAATRLFTSVAKGTVGGLATVDGFITNTGGYDALIEPYLTIDTRVGGKAIRESKWADWNSFLDEVTYAKALRTKLISLGFDQSIGMLVDTSRDGWGGPARPRGQSVARDLDTFVDESRVDRRHHAGNWCNQEGAGMGERPMASPAIGIDAYVWMKPPGESDGSSVQLSDDPAFDRMCDPTFTGSPFNAFHRTGALPNAPAFGEWFPEQFAQLMTNAYPPLS